MGEERPRQAGAPGGRLRATGPEKATGVASGHLILAPRSAPPRPPPHLSPSCSTDSSSWAAPQPCRLLTTVFCELFTNALRWVVLSGLSSRRSPATLSPLPPPARAPLTPPVTLGSQEDAALSRQRNAVLGGPGLAAPPCGGTWPPHPGQDCAGSTYTRPGPSPACVHSFGTHDHSALETHRDPQ